MNHVTLRIENPSGKDVPFDSLKKTLEGMGYDVSLPSAFGIGTAGGDWPLYGYFFTDFALAQRCAEAWEKDTGIKTRVHSLDLADRRTSAWRQVLPWKGI